MYQGKNKNHFLINKPNKHKEFHSNKSSFFFLNSFEWCQYFCNLSSFPLAVVRKDFDSVNNYFILSRSFEFFALYASLLASSWSSRIVPKSRFLFLFSSVTSSSVSFRFLDISYYLVFFFVLLKTQCVVVFMT